MKELTKRLWEFSHKLNSGIIDWDFIETGSRKKESDKAIERLISRGFLSRTPVNEFFGPTYTVLPVPVPEKGGNEGMSDDICLTKRKAIIPRKEGWPLYFTNSRYAQEYRNHLNEKKYPRRGWYFKVFKAA
jgi:hypothetical protein